MYRMHIITMLLCTVLVWASAASGSAQQALRPCLPEAASVPVLGCHLPGEVSAIVLCAMSPEIRRGASWKTVHVQRAVAGEQDYDWVAQVLRLCLVVQILVGVGLAVLIALILGDGSCVHPGVYIGSGMFNALFWLWLVRYLALLVFLESTSLTLIFIGLVPWVMNALARNGRPEEFLDDSGPVCVPFRLNVRPAWSLDRRDRGASRQKKIGDD